MQKWQQNLMNTLYKYKGRGLVQVTGRNSGKSFMSSSAFKRLWDDLYSRPIEDIKLSEGTVYGSRYYTAEPIGGSWPEMQEWCLQTYGESGKHIWGANETPEPQQRWYMNNRKFWFRDEIDRMIFVLKWR